jgi:transketolase
MLLTSIADGDTKVSFTEDVMKRFEAYGWHTQWVKDGDHDLAGIEEAIAKAKEVKDNDRLRVQSPRYWRRSR